MKKTSSLIPIIIMFVILAGLFVFMCLPQNPISVTAQNGIMDLRGQPSAQVSPLHGQWEFVYGEFVMPGDFQNRQPDFINVPDSWADHGYALNGFATYRLTVLTDETNPLTLFLPETDRKSVV